MRLYTLITTSLVTASFLVGCGGSGGDGDNTASAAPVEITTVKQAKNAIAAASSANSGYSNINTRSISREAYTQSCAVSGSMTINVSQAASTKVSSVTTMDNCDDGGGVSNGKMVMDANIDGYKTSSKISMQNFSQKNEQMYFVANLNIDTVSDSQTGASDTTLNGTIHLEEYIYNDVQDYGYTNFNVKQSGYNSGIEINGKTSISSKNYSCVNGTYDIKTTTPLQIGYNGYTAGEMEINGAVYHYNNDGTVTVTLANGETSTIEQDTTPDCN